MIFSKTHRQTSTCNQSKKIKNKFILHRHIVFLLKMSILSHWDVTSVYMQLKNIAREIPVSERERV